MRVALHDGDSQTDFPNYALMKISAWHKARGDGVEWWNPLLPYDRIYSSKVFTFTPENPYLPPDTIKGGTGYGIYEDLPAEIDAMFPDYSIYPDVDYAIGFLTRGCIRKCPWCVVPKKEGKIRPYRTWREIKRPDCRDIKFMDNNVLACPHGIEQMKDMIGQDIRIDFNQGLDARLIDDDIAEILAKLKWIEYIRMSADTDAMLEVVLRTIDRLKSHGIRASKLFIYVLVQDVKAAERRVLALKEAGARPFAQPYRDLENNIEPTAEARRFARWVNLHQVFNKTKSFAEFYDKNRSH